MIYQPSSGSIIEAISITGLPSLENAGLSLTIASRNSLLELLVFCEFIREYIIAEVTKTTSIHAALPIRIFLLTTLHSIDTWYRSFLLLLVGRAPYDNRFQTI